MNSVQDLPMLGIDATEPYALLADVHGSLEALQAVTAWLDERGIRQAVVLGDLIGYGASPVEVVREIRNRGWSAIRGNHEDMFCDFSYIEARGSLKESARKCIEWTRDQLGSDDSEYLSTLPAAARIGDEAIVVHGSLVDPKHCYAYIYDLSLDLNLRRLNSLDTRAGTRVLHGHTHTPKVFAVRGSEWEEQSTLRGVVTLSESARYFVNPGSVGYSRDGEARAKFMVWDPGTKKMSLQSLAYDMKTAIAKIRQAGYYDAIIERLRQAH